MIITLTFKTSDVVDDAVNSLMALQAPKTEQELEEFHNCDDNLVYWREDRAAEIKQRLALWIKYGEIVTITFDLINETATVCKA